jgi:hypothetical protein
MDPGIVNILSTGRILYYSSSSYVLSITLPVTVHPVTCRPVRTTEYTIVRHKLILPARTP